MNMRATTEEYRLTHWASIMRDRQESGLSIRSYCKKAGYHENRYYYWQRKLRAMASDVLAKAESESTNLRLPLFAEVQVVEESKEAYTAEVSQITVESGGLRITTDSGYPIEKLAMLLRIEQTCLRDPQKTRPISVTEQ